jgi:hypothetical protein
MPVKDEIVTGALPGSFKEIRFMHKEDRTIVEPDLQRTAHQIPKYPHETGLFPIVVPKKKPLPPLEGPEQFRREGSYIIPEMDPTIDSAFFEGLDCPSKILQMVVAITQNTQTHC